MHQDLMARQPLPNTHWECSCGFVCFHRATFMNQHFTVFNPLYQAHSWAKDSNKYFRNIQCRVGFSASWLSCCSGCPHFISECWTCLSPHFPTSDLVSCYSTSGEMADESSGTYLGDCSRLLAWTNLTLDALGI